MFNIFKKSEPITYKLRTKYISSKYEDMDVGEVDLEFSIDIGGEIERITFTLSGSDLEVVSVFNPLLKIEAWSFIDWGCDQSEYSSTVREPSISREFPIHAKELLEFYTYNHLGQNVRITVKNKSIWGKLVKIEQLAIREKIQFCDIRVVKERSWGI